MLCINGKTKKNYIHTLFRIIFKQNRIESQKTKLYVFESYHIKYYHKNVSL